MAMESYRSYMDRITVSDALHEKLMQLPEKAPAKPKPPLFLRTAALAACAALLVGAGAYGIWQLTESERPMSVVSSSSMALAEAIDLAPADEDFEPGQKSIGGYETHETRAGVPIVCYHILPWIDYGEGGTTSVSSLDWDFPPDAVRLDLTHEQIAALLGGEDALTTHLDWGAYELTGRAAWNPDGTFAAAYIQGYEGPLDHWEFLVWAGQLPPTCVALAESVTQDIWNVSVTAEKIDTESGVSRSVSFMQDDYGYRFSLTGADADHAELLVSRLVRRMIADDGFYPDRLSSDGTIHLPPASPDPVYPDTAEPSLPGDTSSAAMSVPPANS